MERSDGTAEIAKTAERLAMRPRLAWLVFFVVGLGCAGSAVAQTGPRGFIGAGIDLLSHSALDVSRTTDTEPLPLAWFVEGGIFGNARVGVGAELIHAPARTSNYSSSAAALTEEYQETSLLGVVRVRTAQSDRVAFDLLAGGGIIFQRRTDSSQPRSTGAAPIQNETTFQSPAFVFGGDVPVTVASHFAIVPTVRLYLFRSGGPGGGLIAVEPSTSLAAGVSGRVTW